MDEPKNIAIGVVVIMGALWLGFSVGSSGEAPHAYWIRQEVFPTKQQCEARLKDDVKFWSESPVHNRITSADLMCRKVK